MVTGFGRRTRQPKTAYGFCLLKTAAMWALTRRGANRLRAFLRLIPVKSCYYSLELQKKVLTLKVKFLKDNIFSL
jgi:hypothetical protein